MAKMREIICKTRFIVYVYRIGLALTLEATAIPLGASCGAPTNGPGQLGPNVHFFQGGQLGPRAQLSGAQLSIFSGRTIGPKIPRTVQPITIQWAKVTFDAYLAL